MEEDEIIDFESELAEINTSLDKYRNFNDGLLKKQFTENVNIKIVLHKFLKDRSLDKLSEEELSVIIDICKKVHDVCSQNIVNIKYSLSLNT